MRIGILDIDTKKEKNNREAVEKYPNPACGKIYGYHKMNGDEIFYPWDAKTKVDKLYISTIFSWTKKPLLKMLPIYEKYAKEILIGGSGWDDYTSFKEYIITDLPPEIKKVHHRWTYELYDIDYGIGKTSEGCHVGCGFCMVPKKEGLQERRVNTIEDIINPKYYDRNPDGSLKHPGSDHIVLMNNNSLADPGFYDDVNMINELKLSVHWDQANDITLIGEKNAAALGGVNFRGFTGKRRSLYFAADLMVKRKVIDPWEASAPVLDALGFKKYDNFIIDDKGNYLFAHKSKEEKPKPIKVEYDMMKVIPEKVKMLKEYGILPSHLNWYMLIGWNTTLEEDLMRFHMLNDLGCNVFAMKFRDLTGKVDVDWKGNPQSPHVNHLRRWINGHAFRSCKRFEDFDDYKNALHGSLITQNLF